MFEYDFKVPEKKKIDLRQSARYSRGYEQPQPYHRKNTEQAENKLRLAVILLHRGT